MEKFSFSELKIVSYVKCKLHEVTRQPGSWALLLFRRLGLGDKNQLLKKGKKEP